MTIKGKPFRYFGASASGTDVLDAVPKPGAFRGIKRNQNLPLKIMSLQESEDRTRKRAPPNGIAHKDDVISSHIMVFRKRRESLRLHFFLGFIATRIIPIGIGLLPRNLEKIATAIFLNQLRH